MMNPLLRRLALLPLCLTVACGGDSDDGESGATPSGPIPLDSYGEAVAQALCGALAPCCNQAGFPTDEATCEAFMSAQLQQSVSGVAPERYTYDAEAAGQCVTRLRQIGASGSCEAESDIEAISCDAAFVGTVEPGGTCAADLECAPGPQPGDEVECERGFDDEPDTCVVERRASEGDPCYWSCDELYGGSGYSCSGVGIEEPAIQGRCFSNDGLRCSNDGLCIALAAVGEECSIARDCTRDAFCGLENTCQPRLGAGEPCDADVCAEGLYCDGAMCAPQVQDGEPCSDNDQCEGGNCNEGTCSGGLSELGLGFVCALVSGGLSIE